MSTSPYIETVLYAPVVLQADQLNNDIYLNMKQNLIKDLEGKCYKNYGYIEKIYKIIDKTPGKIIHEDTMASIKYTVKFSCRLCYPIEQMQIICKIDQIADVFISLRNGPIHIFVTPERINTTNFHNDKGHIKLKAGELLSIGTIVKIIVLTTSFVDKNDRILVIGYLDNIANNEEISQFYGYQYQK
jgi:DNA-directed RNA polymerase subunit E'/Rpb7